MEIVKKSSPHLRRPNARVVRMMRDVTIALMPLVVFAIINHGLNAVFILLAAVLSMVLTEYVYYQIQDLKAGNGFTFKNKQCTIYNFSVITSGLIYGLTLPDQTPITVVIIGGVVGVFLAKLIFGGMGQNIFNIAAFARVFVVLSFGAAVGYTQFVDANAGATALGILNRNIVDANVTNTYSLMTMFTGIGLPGSLGETSAMLILVGGIYLLLRRSFDVVVPLTYIGTVFVLSCAVMISQGIGFWYPMTHLLSGGLIFGAVFMATDPITSPVTRPGRIYFAFGIGVITFFIRLFGNLPEGVVFAILIMNMFVPAIDYAKWSHQKFNLRRLSIFSVVIALTILITIVGVNYAG